MRSPAPRPASLRRLVRPLGLAIAMAGAVTGCPDARESGVASEAAAAEDRPSEASPPGGPAQGARPENRRYGRQVRARLAGTHHPGDGQGRARLVAEGDGPITATSGVPRGYRIVYEAGPEGLAAGGALVLELWPLGAWTSFQLDAPQAPGYTTVSVDAQPDRLRPHVASPQTLVVPVGGRGLDPGEAVHIHYGAGEAGAVARIAEETARLWIAVDGDGDDVRSYLPPLELRVAPGPAAAFALTLPATARPGEELLGRVAAVDAHGNAATGFAGEVTLRSLAAPVLELPEKVVVTEGAGGRAAFRALARRPGVARLRAEAEGAVRGWSNPMEVALYEPRILFGDVHGHSSYSDGAGSPEAYFRFARDVAGLDVAALTDHDYWGPQRLDRSPARWAEIREQARSFHEPDRFVTLLGYEWTSWVHGHRHVLYFEDRGEIFSAIDPRYDTPALLWEALSGESALTFAHHSAGGPSRLFATNWEFPPDPVLEPLTEVASVHGSSEAPDAPQVVAQAVPGNFVRDVLDRGYRLGFIGSGDSHSGHPGAVPDGSPPRGLAGILCEKLTRGCVLEAMRARRVYATNGPRILLRAALGGRPMGASVASPEPVEVLEARVVSPRHLAKVELVRSGTVVRTWRPPEGSLAFSLHHRVEGLRRGEYLYLRVVQTDGGAAWSSPFFVGER